MNIFFSVLSAVYIAAIFLLADSPMVPYVTAFNPYSLLHIPLYGILTILLILSFSKNSTNLKNPSNSSNPTNSISPTNSRNYLIAGVIAVVVGIADEIHQAYIPGRDASVTDVFLDVIGIGVTILIFLRFGRALIRFLDRTFQRVEPNN
jgi:hypothetical protein